MKLTIAVVQFAIEQFAPEHNLKDVEQTYQIRKDLKRRLRG